jgi:hypothetical protein
MTQPIDSNQASLGRVSAGIAILVLLFYLNDFSGVIPKSLFQ